MDSRLLKSYSIDNLPTACEQAAKKLIDKYLTCGEHVEKVMIFINSEIT